jgi:phosphoglycolate phosphatase
VLADSTVPITSCVARTLQELGHGERSREQLLAFIGPPGRVGFAELIGEPPDSAAVDAAVSRYRELYAVALRDTPTYPGVPEAVRVLHDDGWTLAVATSKPARYAEPVLEAIGLRDAFSTVAGPRDDGTADKSHTVKEALDAVGGRAAGLVGDRRYDVEAAHAHGLRALGALWGFGSREELERAGADLFLAHPSELVRALADPPPGG